MINIETSDIEQKLFSIWQDALGIETFKVEDNLFDIGGNSLIAMMILHDIEKEFGISLEVSGLLELNTISKQAQKIKLEVEKSIV